MPHHGEDVVDDDTRTSTIVVAASNSLDPTLADEAYRCSGALDHVEINNALVAAAAVNGSVELLEGDYYTTLTLSVAVNVVLKAVGWGAVIHFNAGGNAITIAGDNVKLRDFKIVIVAGAGDAGTRPTCIRAETRTNLEITKVWLIGDESVANDGSALRQCGIFFDAVTFSRIALCKTNDHMRHGIRLQHYSKNNTVTGNTCNGNTQHGISLSGDSENNTLTGNTCNGNTQNGIRVSDAADNTLTGNTCNENGDEGIYLSTASGNNTLTGNTCNGNTVDGIHLSGDSDNNTLTGNTCNGNTQHGIHLSVGLNNTITGNTCNGNTENGIIFSTGQESTLTGNTCNDNRHGIYLAGSSGNTVTGNTCQGNTEDGIQLLSSSNNNTVIGNISLQNVHHGIFLDASSDNTVVGNTCNENDVNNTGTYDGIHLRNGSDGNLVLGNTCKDNDRWGIMVDNDSDFNKVSNNYTARNTSGSINVNGATCDGNEMIFNTVEEGAPVDTGTLTRASGNFDPSANAYIAIIGVAPF
ncbi:hypothetical protein ES703_26728 [subsurface metagenome]